MRSCIIIGITLLTHWLVRACKSLYAQRGRRRSRHHRRDRSYTPSSSSPEPRRRHHRRSSSKSSLRHRRRSGELRDRDPEFSDEDLDLRHCWQRIRRDERLSLKARSLSGG
ncbi:hypothetical protein M758_UG195700 [Ceratodon purpureus]|nr:hypothetical protein M758_UG195700 [Ceratodon purpureus]